MIFQAGRNPTSGASGGSVPEVDFTSSLVCYVGLVRVGTPRANVLKEKERFLHPCKSLLLNEAGEGNPRDYYRSGFIGKSHDSRAKVVRNTIIPIHPMDLD